ncbi:hypothetical protein HDV04_005720 [Boothiomyces sp. JEL0838]|nr:hypothetical protein HDV04_005720 [Boothiomyces sp. JEL0838]
MLEKLPPDILEYGIIYHLDSADLCKLAAVNKSLRRRLHTFNALFKKFKNPDSIWPELNLIDRSELQMFFRRRNENRLHFPETMQDLFDEFQIQPSNLIFPKLVVFLNNFLCYNNLIPIAKQVELLISKDSDLDGFCNISRIETVSKITTLYKLTDTDLDLLTTGLHRLNKLEELHIHVTPSSASATLLSQRISNTNITKLSLSMCDLDDSFITLLAARLPYTRIGMLNLSYNKITGIGAAALANAINMGFSLNKLILNGNRIATEGMAFICKALPNSKLTELSVMYNNLLNDDYNLLFEQLSKCRLEKIDYDLRFGGLARPDSPLITNLAKSQLTQLSVSLSQDALPSFLSSLIKSKVVDLTFSKFCRIDLSFIAALQAILPCAKLNVLNFSKLYLSTKEYHMLFSSLPVSLKCLSLEHATGLNDESFQDLIDYLQNSNVEALNLAHCPITPIGIRYLLETIPKSRLQKLVLHHTRIPKMEMTNLLRLFASSNLRYLDVSHNYEQLDSDVLKCYKWRYTNKTLVF